ncbi:MAG: hypothetical protein V3V96_08580 [Acidiferrobacterales bacterium]
MMQHKTFSRVGACLLATTLAWAQLAVGASTRQIFAAPERNGKIEQLNLQSHELIIDDKAFKLTGRVEVYTHRGFQTTSDSLKKGMRVAFDIKKDTSGSPTLTTIWILPKKGHKP